MTDGSIVGKIMQLAVRIAEGGPHISFNTYWDDDCLCIEIEDKAAGIKGTFVFPPYEDPLAFTVEEKKRETWFDGPQEVADRFQKKSKTFHSGRRHYQGAR